MDSFLADLRYGARMLWKSKALTAVAVLSLAAGIGANAAIFGIVDAVLFRAPAVSAPDELARLYVGDRQSPYETASYPNYLEFRATNRVFSGMAAYGISQFRLRAGDDVLPVWGEVVSGNYFDVLGVRPQGRGFLPEEDQVPNRNPVVVIGDGLWRRTFNADPAIIGRTITLNNLPLTVVGIAPSEYTGMTRGWEAEVWVPAMMSGALEPHRGGRDGLVASEGSRWVTMIGRRAPGVTLEQVRARFEVLSREMLAAHPDRWKRENGRDLFVTVQSERQSRVHPQLRPLVTAGVALVFVVVDLVLLIACMNLASILFARAVARRSEIAVRLAMGAGRGRIVRQLLTENILLATIAAVAGIALAFWGLDVLTATMPALPEGIRVALDVQVNWRVVSYSVGFAVLTGLLFGLAPALHASRASLSTVLKDDAAAVTARHHTSRLRQFLVVGQVALSLLLLIGAGLVIRSLDRIRPTRLGFATTNMIVAPLPVDEASYDRRRNLEFLERLAERTAALPGVQSVSLTEGVPGGFMSRARRSTQIEGYTPAPNEDMQIDRYVVGPSYFTNMGVPVVQGRDFAASDRDGAPCVTMVNEAFARRYFPGAPSVLGKHVARLVPGAPGQDYQREMCAIVGVFRDNAWQSLNKDVLPFYAMPVFQDHFQSRMTLLVSSTGDPATLVTAVRQIVRDLAPSMPLRDIQTLDQHFRVMRLPFLLLGYVIGACGALALLIATVGIYGVVSFTVAQRQREVGIRMALGALGRDVLRLIVSQGMTLVSYGLAIGLLLGFALTRVLTSLPLGVEVLFGISATDALTFVGVTLALGIVALIACYVPAVRATRVDPMVTLRL